jgi:hypothetical protein
MGPCPLPSPTVETRSPPARTPCPPSPPPCARGGHGRARPAAHRGRRDRRPPRSDACPAVGGRAQGDRPGPGGVQELGHGRRAHPDLRQVLAARRRPADGGLHRPRRRGGSARRWYERRTPWSAPSSCPATSARCAAAIARTGARIGLTWVKPNHLPVPASARARGRVLEPDVPAGHARTGGRRARPRLKVSTWTVDKPRHMARVVAAGVDAIVSNRIGELRRQLALWPD